MMIRPKVCLYMNWNSYILIGICLCKPIFTSMRTLSFSLFIAKQHFSTNIYVFFLFCAIPVVVEEKKEDESTKKRSLFSRFGGSKDKVPATPPNTPAIASPTSESATSSAISQQGRTDQFFRQFRNNKQMKLQQRGSIFAHFSNVNMTSTC